MIHSSRTITSDRTVYNDSSLSSMSLDRNYQEVINLPFVSPGLHSDILKTEKMLHFGTKTMKVPAVGEEAGVSKFDYSRYSPVSKYTEFSAEKAPWLLLAFKTLSKLIGSFHFDTIIILWFEGLRN